MKLSVSRAGMLLLIVLPAAAAGASLLTSPTLLSPANGATVRTSHPVFRWSLPAGERAEAVYVARSPEATSQGFVTGNVVLWANLAAGDRAWRPTRPLAAGRYWWAVASRDEQTTATAFSPPWQFTIPIALRVLSITTDRARRSVSVRWTGNVERATVTLRTISRGGVVWSAARTQSGTPLGGVNRTVFAVPARVAGALDRGSLRVSLTARS